MWNEYVSAEEPVSDHVWKTYETVERPTGTQPSEPVVVISGQFQILNCEARKIWLLSTLTGNPVELKRHRPAIDAGEKSRAIDGGRVVRVARSSHLARKTTLSRLLRERLLDKGSYCVFRRMF